MRRLLVLSVLPLVFLAACGGGGSAGGSEALPGVTVQGDTKSKPKVQLDDGYSVDNMQVKTLVKGDGEKVGGTDTVTVDYVGINGRNGQEFDSSWKNGQPATFSLGPGMISGFNKALTGQTVGSRVVAAIPPEDGYGTQGNPQAGIKGTDTLVFVIDIRGVTPSEATGDPVPVPEDLPHLLTDKSGLPQQFHAVKTTAPAPKEVEVHPVLQGDGPPIKAGQTVTMNLLGEVYPAGSPFVQTYGQSPQSLPVGQGQPLPCFDRLVGQSLGSRVILICPPDSAFGPNGNPQAGIKGSDTLIFAVDLPADPPPSRRRRRGGHVAAAAKSAKSERLMNLVICLLVARTYVGKARIREVVQGYHGQSDDAFEKMFERDKDELRELGVPIEVGHVDRAFEDEPGYRIRRQAFELPDIRLDGDEAAVVGLAARVWQHASLAEATSGALVKLRAGGVDVDTSALSVVEPHLAAPEPAFEPLWNAVLTRTAVKFGYRRADASPHSEPAVRTLEPWGIVSWHGHWYVVGHDRDRDAPRMFRLSRVEGKVTKVGRAGSFSVPEGTDVRALASGLAPEDPPARCATLRVRSGHGFALRRSATSSGPAHDGWDRIEVPYGSVESMAELVTSHGDDVVVEQPEDLRAAVVTRLRRLAGVDAGVSA